ncbi:hypothetical protein NG895_27105 [Aeoliella sp. ICT_H6.2]|uniref:Uncharacterized protein n=1 Tax=Aeoliella straminimaris TaxID=2954799 RepID=A0A9X2JIY6_9BACT|nr:hypothetical protein [Aeoliella straminimaris]MCO6047590.1 hypothetical protein [Aeoliella straminimaris]
MNDREKKLGAAVALLVILWGGNWTWQKYAAWRDSAVTRRTAAESDSQNVFLQRTQARIKVDKLREWRKQSLPADLAVAKSEYRGWLIKQLQDARLDVDDVVPQRTGQRSNAYQAISYQVTADGRADAVVRFLDSFYRSGQLHKITSMTLTPVSSRSLQMMLTVEALVVDGVARQSGLYEGESDRLALASADEYVERIVERNPFVAYEPPPPARPPVGKDEPKRDTTPPPPRFNEAEFAFLTGVVSVGDRYQAWVTVRTWPDRLRLHAGDDIEVGQFKGKVVRVEAKQLVVETEEGDVIEIGMGEKLTDGRQLPSTAAGS